jgi:hypothetical protein
MIGMNFKKKRNIKENIMLIIMLCKTQKRRDLNENFVLLFFSQWFWQVFHKLDDKNKKKFLCKYSIFKVFVLNIV